MQLEPARERGRENPTIQNANLTTTWRIFLLWFVSVIKSFYKHISMCLTQILIHFLFTKKKKNYVLTTLESSCKPEPYVKVNYQLCQPNL